MTATLETLTDSVLLVAGLVAASVDGSVTERFSTRARAGGHNHRGSHRHNGASRFGSITEGMSAGWRFVPDHDEPVETGVPNFDFIGPGKELFFTPPLENWITLRRRPTGPVRDIEFAGRHCWEVELALQRNPAPATQLVIDTETGAVLAHHSADGAEARTSST